MEWTVSRKFEKFIFDYSLINIPILVPLFPLVHKSKKKNSDPISFRAKGIISSDIFDPDFFFSSFSFVINTAWNFEREASLVPLIFSSNRLSKRTRLPPFTESRATLPIRITQMKILLFPLSRQIYGNSYVNI